MADRRTTEELRAEVRAARRRERGPQPVAEAVTYRRDSNRIELMLEGDWGFSFPANNAHGLEEATPDQLQTVRLISDGEVIEVEAIDAHVSVPGLIARLIGMERWAPAYLGQRKSAVKAAAARANGAKGGRPRKVRADTSG